jgi:thymidylate kinase
VTAPDPAPGAAAVAPAGLRPELAEAFAALDSAGLRWVMIRGALDRPGGDVDVLVPPAQLDRAQQALESAGFLRRRAPEHEPHRLHLRRAADGWFVLDLLAVVESAGGRSRTLPVLDLLLDRAVRDGEGVSRLRDDDRDWLALVRAVHRGPASLTGAPALDSPLVPGIDSVLGQGAAAAGAAAAGRALAGDDAPLRALLDQWRPVLKPVPGAAPARARKLREALDWRAPGRRGVSVAVLGPDGAGKSTLVEGLRDSVPMAVSIRYLGVFRQDPHEPLWKRVPGVGLGVKLVTLRWRSTKGAVDVRRGRLLLYDRHVVDALLRPGKPTARARISYTLLEHSCPAPDLFVVLDAPGEVMFARKGEHTVELLEERRQRYLELQGRYPNVAVVDATQDAGSVRRDVEDLVWRTWSR